MKRLAQKSLAFISIVCFVFTFYYTHVFADSIAHTFTAQSSSGVWSNGSIISIQVGGSPDASLRYINKGDNSSVRWNYFSWYYYDNLLGYFQFDALSNPNENVRVIWSTSKCSGWYGYKLGWYAYSENFGFIDFDYDANTYVYYCVSDESLYGYAYSEALWFQNFEWITFPILVNIDEEPIATPTQTGTFVNDNVDILDESIRDNTGESNASANNSNFQAKTIQNDVFNFEVDKESLFYIIK